MQGRGKTEQRRTVRSRRSVTCGHQSATTASHILQPGQEAWQGTAQGTGTRTAREHRGGERAEGPVGAGHTRVVTCTHDMHS